MIPGGQASQRVARLIGGGLVLCALVFHLSGLRDVGLTDDDRFYVPAAVSYAKFWAGALDGLAHGRLDGFSRPRIDRAFRVNHEHPPLAKYAMGLTWWVFAETLGWLDRNAACRVGIVLLAALCTYLVFSLGRRSFGLWAGIFAALALNLLPRFAFHCRVPTLDLPVTTLYLFTAYAAWRARDSLRWGLFSGVVFGLALATKLNAPFVVLPLGLFWLYSGRRGFTRTRSGAALRLPPLTTAALSMLVLGPLVFFISWPWIWHDTVARLAEYVRFHLHHYGIFLFYLGRIYGQAFAPWHASFVLLAGTLPLVPLVLALRGTGVGLAGLRWRVLRDGGAENPEREAALFVLLNAFFCVAIVAFPDNPVYGGVKLFLPALPFVALLAGLGFSRLCSAHLFPLCRTRAGARLAAAACGLVLLLPGAIELGRVHPYLLSYYGPVVGGVRGAHELGLERQYYDIFYPELADWLSTELPPGTTISFAPNNKEYRAAAPFFRESGRLRKDLKIVPPAQADVLVLTHERRWRHYPELVRLHRGKERLWELDLQGVPLLTVYQVK